MLSLQGARVSSPVRELRSHMLLRQKILKKKKKKKDFGRGHSHLMASQVAPVVKNPLANTGDNKKHGLDPWVGKIPWRRKWHPTPVFLPGENPMDEESGGLHSMGSQRAGPNRATKHTESFEGLTGDGGGAFTMAHSYTPGWWPQFLSTWASPERAAYGLAVIILQSQTEQEGSRSSFRELVS